MHGGSTIKLVTVPLAKLAIVANDITLTDFPYDFVEPDPHVEDVDGQNEGFLKTMPSDCAATNLIQPIFTRKLQTTESHNTVELFFMGIPKRRPIILILQPTKSSEVGLAICSIKW
eukprot:SAG31_NODE_2239_length_6115_cov_2.178191_10_plen_116_part_00